MLATCVNDAKINNYMLRMRGQHTFPSDFLLLQGKHNGFRHIAASAQREFFGIRNTFYFF